MFPGTAAIVCGLLQQENAGSRKMPIVVVCVLLHMFASDSLPTQSDEAQGSELLQPQSISKMFRALLPFFVYIANEDRM